MRRTAGKFKNAHMMKNIRRRLWPIGKKKRQTETRFINTLQLKGGKWEIWSGLMNTEAIRICFYWLQLEVPKELMIFDLHISLLDPLSVCLCQSPTLVFTWPTAPLMRAAVSARLNNPDNTPLPAAHSQKKQAHIYLVCGCLWIISFRIRSR